MRFAKARRLNKMVTSRVEDPKAKYIVGKLYTQRIERENLTLRNA